MSEESKSYQQTKVFELHIGLKSGASKLVGHMNTREQLSSEDFTWVENKLFTEFTKAERFEFGIFYILARSKGASGSSLAEMFDEEQPAVETAVDSEEDVPL